MSQAILVRGLDRADLPCLRVLLESTSLFPPEMLQPMAEPFLSKHAPHHWLVACKGEQVVGFAYAEPERMTGGTFNLLAIAVERARQGEGIGKALVCSLEEKLRNESGRVLIVETSSLEEYDKTRAFYLAQAFVLEARIRDFYTEGEDKLVFWKHL